MILATHRCDICRRGVDVGWRIDLWFKPAPCWNPGRDWNDYCKGILEPIDPSGQVLDPDLWDQP